MKRRKIQKLMQQIITYIASQFCAKLLSRHGYLSHRTINANPSDDSEAIQQQQHKTCKTTISNFCKNYHLWMMLFQLDGTKL